MEEHERGQPEEILPTDEEIGRRDAAARWLEENVPPEDRADYYASCFRRAYDGT